MKNKLILLSVIFDSRFFSRRSKSRADDACRSSADIARYAALFKSLQIRVERVAVLMKFADRTARQIEIFVDHRRRNVVVSVNDYRLLMNFQSALPKLRIRSGRHRLREILSGERKSEYQNNGKKINLFS